MLNYSEIKRGVIIEYNKTPYKVLSNSILKKNRNKPHNQTTIKSLISGKTINVTFHSSDKVKEALVKKKIIKYLYQKKNEIFFCLENNPKIRFKINFEDIKEQIKFLKNNDLIIGLYFNENIFGIDIPIKIELKVKESPNAVKGNTSSGAKKKVLLENGLELLVPLFIEKEDIVIVNTETGEYSERKIK
ncbi:MAG: hypothetical protein LRZ98_00395 [Candidatus Pacebacteria bacterium]|nr:hypothetical protein [Candidatus Paceibacterota bacterium]